MYYLAMKYDLMVFEIKNIKARTIIAHQLARDPDITLQEAFEKIDDLPVVLFRDVEELTMQNYVSQYYHHGIILKAIQKSVIIPEKTENSLLFDNKDVISIFNSSETVPKSQKERNKSVSIDNITIRNGYSFGESSIKNKNSIQTVRKKITKPLLALLFLSFVIVMGLIIALSGKNHFKKSWLVQKTIYSKSGLISEKIDEVNEVMITSNTGNRKKISEGQKRFSILMSDSAKLYSSDINKMINFYKIAISFNRFNLNAWIGLLSVYQQAGMESDRNTCINDIKDVFGEEVFSISGLLNGYGDIIDSYISDDSVLTISFKAKSNLLDNVQREIYSLVKALNSQYGYESITLSVVFKKSSTMIVHYRSGMRLATFEQFKEDASINIFD